MPKVKVLLTLRPDEPWEVDLDELPNLAAEGLLLKVLDDDEPEPASESAAIPPDVIIPDAAPVEGA